MVMERTVELTEQENAVLRLARQLPDAERAVFLLDGWRHVKASQPPLARPAPPLSNDRAFLGRFPTKGD